MTKLARLSIVVVAVCLVLTPVATADESDGVARSLYPLQALTCPEPLLRGCCDKYCPKAQPCVHCFCHGCEKDVYCYKPCPCVPTYHGGCTAGGYCPKPCPDPCRPLFADYFTCAGYGAGCTGSSTNVCKADPPTALFEAANDPTTGRDNSSVSSASAPQH